MELNTNKPEDKGIFGLPLTHRVKILQKSILEHHTSRIVKIVPFQIVWFPQMSEIVKTLDNF